jgi:diamine N-acetyltransferase
MPDGWEGRNIRLVPLDLERHFENCVRWLNDPQVTEWTLIGDYPLTRLAEREFFEKACRPGPEADTVVLAIETRDDEQEHIGTCGLHDIQYRHGIATAGIMIGRPKLWSRGLGTDAFAVLTRYAFDVLGLRLLVAEAFAENERSVRMQRTCGYQQVGCVPQRFWKRGAYRDMLSFALSRAEWTTRNRENP